PACRGRKEFRHHQGFQLYRKRCPPLDLCGYHTYEVYRYCSEDSSKGSSWLEDHGTLLAETYEEAYYDHNSSTNTWYTWYVNNYVYYWVEDRYGNVSNIVRLHQ
ncbi:MAG: hypothetical protein IIT57_08455, partial [Treponema sp.]|nr:hypothetical protein [Treponema sp.]